MSKMTGIAVPALLAAMAVGAAPASAAPAMHRHQAANAPAPVHYAGFGEATNLHRDIVRLHKSINRALASQRVSPRRAAGLRRDVNRLETLLAQYKRGGVTRYEARTIETRIAEIDRALRFDRPGNGRRRG